MPGAGSKTAAPEESIFDLLPRQQAVIEKQPRYKSKVRRIVCLQASGQLRQLTGLLLSEVPS